MCCDQHVTLIPNKQTTFSCLQTAMRLEDTVLLNFPVKRALYTARNTFVHRLYHFAAPLNRVWIWGVCQSNNKVNVIEKLSVKFTLQKYGNYYYGNGITTPKVPEEFNNPTRTIVMFMTCYIITKSMRALWLVNQLWVIVPVNPRKNRASSELLHKSNRPQVSMGKRLINHLGCGS